MGACSPPWATFHREREAGVGERPGWSGKPGLAGISGEARTPLTGSEDLPGLREGGTEQGRASTSWLCEVRGGLRELLLPTACGG